MHSHQDAIRVSSFDAVLFISLLVLFFIPNFLYVAFDFASLAPGLLVASSIVIVLNAKSIFSARVSLLGLICSFGFFLAMCFFSVFVFMSTGESKSLVSLVLFFVLLSALVLGWHIFEADGVAVEASVLSVVLILIFLGWLKFFWQPDFSGYASYSKSVFPFSEESHYALLLGLLASGVVVNAGYKVCFIVLINIIALALLMPSLSLLLFSCVVLFLSLLRVRLVFLFFILMFLVVVAACLLYFYIFELEYFQGRVALSDTSNLTALVFLQGWGLAISNLIGTSGFGLGFQMLGSKDTFLPDTSEEIYRITGAYFNIPDAGFLAAKLIAEFGVLGVLISLIYSFFLFRIAFSMNYNLRRFVHMSARDQSMARKFFLVGGFFWAFLVEFFFRGMGYFSPGFFIFIAAVLVVFKARPQPKRVLNS